MKKSKFIYLLILPFLIFSCDSFNKFDHFGIGNTFEESFTVPVPLNSDKTFAGSATFSASDDETIKENIQNIQEFEVSEISLKITNYKGNEGAIANGTFSVMNNDVLVGDEVTLPAIDFAKLYASQEFIVLPLTQSTIDALETAYLAEQVLTVEAAGAITGATEDLTIEFTVYMTIEATVGNQ